VGWRGETEVGEAEDEDVAGGFGFDAELGFIAYIEAKMPVEVGVLPLGADAEGAVEVSGDQGVDAGS